MGTITPSLTYVDGQTLDAERHNENIYDNTVGKGIMSEANGGLESDNLHADFKVESEHLQVEQTSLARQGSNQTSIDCFQSAFGRAPEDTYTTATAPSDLFVAIPGCSIRFYQPYDASCAFFSWSLFIDPYNYREFKPDSENGQSVTTVKDPLMCIAAKIDGTLIEHTRRKITQTVWGAGNAAVASKVYANGEAKCGQWWDMTHMIPPAAGLSKGYHDLQICLFMEIMDSQKTVKFYRSWLNSVEGTVRAFQRCAFGIRNAKVVTFL